MGKLIVIEGLDGSGKATQTKLLYDALCKRGERTMQITFPNYDSPSSAPVKMYLGGQFGAKPGDVNAYAASSFYAVDRYASYKTVWGEFYKSGGTVVSDRYTTSNAVHQCSKLPRAQWDAFLDWLFIFEYEQIAIPAPDVVIYLDVEPDVSQQLMTARYHGDEAQKDIHEKDTVYLQSSRSAAQYCAQKLDWRRVACTENGAMRSIEAIHADVMALLG
ncbi:MAG: thymidylate kinase [Ruthenibacterium sp.]